jgi:hypothetical protein
MPFFSYDGVFKPDHTQDALEPRRVGDQRSAMTDWLPLRRYQTSIPCQSGSKLLSITHRSRRESRESRRDWPELRCGSMGNAQSKLRALQTLREFWTSLANAKVSDGSQPPMTFDLSQRESARSRSLDRSASFRPGFRNDQATNPITSNSPATAYTRPQVRREVNPIEETY